MSGSLNESAETEVLCHSRCGMLKIPSYSRPVSAATDLNFTALRRQLKRLHNGENSQEQC
jgi:hypothetical protein